MDEGPLETARATIRGEWTDYNGHMNLAYFVLIFDYATDGFYGRIGLGPDYRARTDRSTFAVETHTSYLAELMEGQAVVCTTQLLGFDEKRIHFFHRMFKAGSDLVAATTEQMAVHVDLVARRVASMPEEIQERLGDVFVRHARLARPAQAGRVIRLAGRARK